MKNLYQITRHLVWLTQFGLSVALPPVLFLLGAVWLKNEFALGGAGRSAVGTGRLGRQPAQQLKKHRP
jgi:hypothetical protein